ncbi:TRAPP trafficking subunit Trs65-domain-containing protein [Pisolithus marmoratus]|nr:TRAPP trafficking subunit Trs65-domain-containing protein [Pisolithus marmoratus]
MTESSFETLFGSCALEVAVPDSSVDFPKRQDQIDDWLTTLQERQVDRKHAFFDEQLRLFLIIKVDHSPPNPLHESRGMPSILVHFLRHVQVSLEATYISHKSAETSATPRADQVTGPPRSSSVGLNNPRPTSLHPPIFPPTTPNPIPSTAEADRKYVQSEGTLLISTIWGQGSAEHSGEQFAVFFSHSRREWVAVYQLFLNVLFLRLPFPDPLLCLTISATLREKPLPLSQTKHPFVTFLLQEDMMPSQDVIAHKSSVESDDPDDIACESSGLQEVNLLDGLVTGSSHSSELEPLYLPSTRLGDVTRRQLLSLPPLSSLERTSHGSNTTRGTHHVLRKSFRVVLEMASGFRVRMRTVFAPHILLPKDRSDLEECGYQCSDQNAFENRNEEWEVGNSERTVVLCIEVENSGDHASYVGFSLEKVDVKIGGDGATTRLVGWGEAARDSTEERTFPLFLRRKEQYNLLYVVSFLNAGNQDDISLTPSSAKLGVLQRAVTISVHGRPYTSNLLLDEGKGSDVLTYLTRTFSSRWNCILDMSSRPREDAAQWQGPSSGTRSALPELPSPFPGAFPSAIVPPPTARSGPQAVAGRRLAKPSSATALYPAGHLSSPPRDLTNPPTSANQTPSSAAMQRFPGFPHMTSTVPPSTPAMRGLSEIRLQGIVVPATPALPVGPGTNSIHSLAQGNRQGTSRASTSIESRTEQDPFVLHTTSSGRPNAARDALSSLVEPIVVSVGLIPNEDSNERLGLRKISVPDIFTLDIFVFNQSSWTRRFEVSYPNADHDQPRKIVQDGVNMISLAELKSTITPVGILPLQNRVRVGPLRPLTCQSVRLEFLALSPGVYSVDLSLTDVETGYLMNLRYVPCSLTAYMPDSRSCRSAIDIVVHEAGRTRGDNACKAKQI